MQNTGLGRRIAAMLYDALLVLALVSLTSLAFIAVRGGEAVETDDNLVFRLTLALVIFTFFVGFWTKSGRTLGMQSWRLQLQTLEGGKPTLGAVTIRFFAALISWASLGLGFVWQLWDKDKLTWHDRISKTCLVYYPKDQDEESSANSRQREGGEQP